MTGYLINFGDHGVFHPGGRCEKAPTDEQITKHNQNLAKLEFNEAKKTGKAIFYYTKTYLNDKTYPGIYQEFVGTWDGSYKWQAVSKESNHNFAGYNGRIDLWFNIDGESWWGVKIGNNDIVHAKRLKRSA